MAQMPLRKLEPSFRESVWGTRESGAVVPQRARQGRPVSIGEVWFEAPEVPLLVKFLFTNEKLSVQVHPDDKYARFHHSSPGKTEMWHVLAAEPGAKIAAGFREPVTQRASPRRRARRNHRGNCSNGSTPRPGDTFFIPAGTVHAIGAGLTICEIQQHSDITYRFFDYGRGRELHLDSALAVSHLGPHAARKSAKVECDYFVTEPLKVEGTITFSPPHAMFS